MSAFNILVDNKTMLFQSRISPFIFKDSTELVQKMLEEANFQSEHDRNIVTKFLSLRNSFSYICCTITAMMTFIGLPFLCCYYNSKYKAYERAIGRIVKSWEEIADKHNQKLMEKGVFARFVQISKVIQNQERTYDDQKFYFEFTFKDGLDQNLIPNNYMNEIPNLLPPPGFN